MTSSSAETVDGDGTEDPQPGHFIVCGGNALAHNLVAMLERYYDAPVTAVVPAENSRHAAAIAARDGGGTTIVSDVLSAEVLKVAEVATARAIAFVDGDDRDTIHAAWRVSKMCEQENKDIQIVLRLFNQRLGDHIEGLIANCTVLSASAVAAPAFANQALDRRDSVHVDGTTNLSLEVGASVLPRDPRHVLAEGIKAKPKPKMTMLPPTASELRDYVRQTGSVEGLVPIRRAGSSDGGSASAGSAADGSPMVGGGPVPGGPAAGVPTAREAAEAAPSQDAEDAPPPDIEDDEEEQRAVLTFQGRPPKIVRSRRARLFWGVVDGFRFFTGAKLRVVLITALISTAVAFAGIWYLARPVGWAVYETLLNLAGSAVPDTYRQPSAVGGAWQRVFQVTITFSGVLLVPVMTAVVLENTESRRNGTQRLPSAGIRGHVVIVGLGNVGTRVAETLLDLGVPVVGIERDPTARGIAALRGRRTSPPPILIGDGPIEDLLERAHVGRARAVVAVTGDDIANLEAVLEARALAGSVRVVVRLFEDNFAENVYEKFTNAASRSVSYLAAPAFAAAMMGRGVLGTLSLYRRVLLIAEIPVEAGSGLTEKRRRDIDVPENSRLLAYWDEKSRSYKWTVTDRTQKLKVGDRIIVAATRGGLAALHQLARPQASGAAGTADASGGLRAGGNSTS